MASSAQSVAQVIGEAAGTAAGAATAPVADTVTAAIKLGMDLIDKIWPNPADKAAAQMQLLQLAQSGELAKLQMQTDVNKIEAASASFWESGWRPGVGWTCGAALAYSFILQPFMVTIIQVVYCIHAHVVFQLSMLPIVDMTQLWPILIGLLGLGAMHMNENIKTAQINNQS